jgi:hypothetical protein
MNVIIQNIQDLEKKFIELVQISMKMRHYKKKWDREYGAPNRNNLARWEERMDEFLGKLEIKDNDQQAELPETNKEIKVEDGTGKQD